MEFRLGKINISLKANQKKVSKSLNSLDSMHGLSMDQDIIQVNNNMQTLVMTKEQYGFSE